MRGLRAGAATSSDAAAPEAAPGASSNSASSSDVAAPAPAAAEAEPAADTGAGDDEETLVSDALAENSPGDLAMES